MKNFKDWMKDEVFSLSISDKVQFINCWADKNNSEKIVYIDRFYFLDQCADMTISEVFDLFREYFDNGAIDAYTIVDGYGHVKVLSNAAIEEMAMDVYNECNGNYDFQDVIDPDYWNYEEYASERLRNWTFDVIDAPEDFDWSGFIEDKCNDESVQDDFVSGLTREDCSSTQLLIDSFVKYVYDRFEDELKPFVVEAKINGDDTVSVTWYSDTRDHAHCEAKSKLFKKVKEYLKYETHEQQQ